MRKLESSSGIFAVPICIAIGAYLLYGAWQSFADAKWPIYLPPQLDGIAFLASLFSPRIGAYIAGSIAGLLGALSCLIGLATILKNLRDPIADDEHG